MPPLLTEEQNILHEQNTAVAFRFHKGQKISRCRDFFFLCVNSSKKWLQLPGWLEFTFNIHIWPIRFADITHTACSMTSLRSKLFPLQLCTCIPLPLSIMICSCHIFNAITSAQWTRLEANVTGIQASKPGISFLLGYFPEPAHNGIRHTPVRTQLR